ERTKGVQMAEGVAMTMVAVVVMTEVLEGALESHMTLEKELVVVVIVLVGSRVTGCVPGLDAMSTILQVAQNVFDAKLLGRLLPPHKSAKPSQADNFDGGSLSLLNQ
ncbi:hypothetical protein L7F22_020454, partial [Adiantum nelumboides]|nr:hypothetical protein [Adiantum nelumboides]